MFKSLDYYKRIFIIGPGGVGKSTCGEILAGKIGYEFIDLDQKFCDRVENIGKFIAEQGYEKYCLVNSKLFDELLMQYQTNVVFSLSSGFLVHEDLDEVVNKNISLLEDAGLSILLLPSVDIEIATEIVVRRQMNRGFGLKSEREREKFQSRFYRYQAFGDIQIYSFNDPEDIANEMLTKINDSLE